MFIHHHTAVSLVIFWETCCTDPSSALGGVADLDLLWKPVWLYKNWSSVTHFDFVDVQVSDIFWRKKFCFSYYLLLGRL